MKRERRDGSHAYDLRVSSPTLVLLLLIVLFPMAVINSPPSCTLSLLSAPPAACLPACLPAYLPSACLPVSPRLPSCTTRLPQATSSPEWSRGCPTSPVGSGWVATAL